MRCWTQAAERSGSLRRVPAVIDQLLHRGRGDVAARVAGGVVDEDLAVAAGDPAVGEGDVGDVADALLAARGQQVAARLVDEPAGIVEGRHEGVEDVAQAGGRVADAVREVQPALRRLDRGGAQAVLDFLDRVVLAVVDDLLRPDDGVLDAVRQGPADAAAGAGLDETVLRAGVEGVLAVDEFRVQDDVALLRASGS